METIESNILSFVKIVCPPAEELSVIINNVRCNQCGLVFQNESRFRLHDLKVHQRKNLDKIVKDSIKYHCPEVSCIYSPTSQRYFTTMKYLKQHYLKVHAAKTFSCTQCDKSFSTEAAKAAHIRVCGLEFICSCFKNFTTYEALLTHAKRHSHLFDEKYKNLLKRASTKNLPAVQLSKMVQKKLPVYIRPYQESNQVIQESKGTKDTRDMAIQTDDFKKIKRTLSPSKANKRRESRQTQTNSLMKEKRNRKTVETQTSAASVRELKKLSTNKKLNLPKKDSQLNNNNNNNNNTFTNDDLFSESPLPLDGMQDLWQVRSLGTKIQDKNIIDDLYDNVTQTDMLPYYQEDSINQINIKNSLFSAATRISRSDPMLTEETLNDRFSSIETQTDRPYFDSIFDSDPPNYSRTYALSSNNETQTTQEFDDMKNLLYSNMCTQTCYDNTSHTETQTDLLNIFDELQ
ncbi:uncharacterized protein LOC130670010 [Microplitis mediator]|uniref:uncharacterized protein LOC130670010 n=1 Tax=Microplitis mediator TaxID=375433 RepID=UPI0025573344|nr:uncharacterized protein LOC130670010 [Microplitis mediator]